MSQNKEIQHLKAVNCHQLELIKKHEAQHKAELEKRSRLEWKAQQEKLQKLKAAERGIEKKEKEIKSLQEHLSNKELECGHLRDELRSVRNAELSPTASMEDISQSYMSKRERDMAIKNSELSYRIRILEGEGRKLKQTKEKLELKLSEAKEELNPLKEYNERLLSQQSDFGAALRSRENKMNQLSKKLSEMKSSHQSLQEEFNQQEKKIHQRNNQALKYESQLQRLKSKNQNLSSELAQLQIQLKDLENLRAQEQSYLMSSLQSPTPTISEDDYLSSSSNSAVQLKEQLDQLEFDKDEIAANYSDLEEKYKKLQAKYNDFKNEYKSVRENCKVLRRNNEQMQQHLKEDTTSQVRKNAARDVMMLEREIQLLRSSKNENYVDEDRERFTILALQMRVNEYTDEVHQLENFIIQQDHSLMQQEQQWKAEYMQLSQSLYNLPLLQLGTEAECFIFNQNVDEFDFGNSRTNESQLEKLQNPYSASDPQSSHSESIAPICQPLTLPLKRDFHNMEDLPHGIFHAQQTELLPTQSNPHFSRSEVKPDNACLPLLPTQTGSKPVHAESEPVHSVSEPEHPGSEPVLPGSEPVHLGSEPVHPGSEPVHPGSEPVHPGSEHVHLGSEPVHPGSELVHPGLERTHPGSEPTHPGSEPAQPGSEPVPPGSEPVPPGSEPVPPGSEPVHSGSEAVHPGLDIVPPGIEHVHPIHPGSEADFPGSEPIYPGLKPIDLGSEPVHPHSEPLYAGSEPAHSGSESIHPGSEPIYPGVHLGSQPVHPESKPIYPGSKPVHPGSEPVYLGSQSVHPKSETVHPGLEPVHPESEPVHAGPQSVHPGLEPVHPGSEPVHAGSQSVHPGSEPVHPGSEPISPGSEPVYPGSEPVHLKSPQCSGSSQHSGLYHHPGAESDIGSELVHQGSSEHSGSYHHEGSSQNPRAEPLQQGLVPLLEPPCKEFEPPHQGLVVPAYHSSEYQNDVSGSLANHRFSTESSQVQLQKSDIQYSHLSKDLNPIESSTEFQLSRTIQQLIHKLKDYELFLETMMEENEKRSAEGDQKLEEKRQIDVQLQAKINELQQLLALECGYKETNEHQVFYNQQVAQAVSTSVHNPTVEEANGSEDKCTQVDLKLSEVSHSSKKKVYFPDIQDQGNQGDKEEVQRRDTTMFTKAETMSRDMGVSLDQSRQMSLSSKKVQVNLEEVNSLQKTSIDEMIRTKENLARILEKEDWSDTNVEMIQVKAELVETQDNLQRLTDEIKELEQHRRVLKEQKELAESTNDYKEKVLKDKNTRIGQLELEISKMRTNAIHLEQCHNVKKDELMNEIVKLKQQIKEKKKNVASPQEKMPPELTSYKQKLAEAENMYTKGQAMLEERVILVEKLRTEITRLEENEAYLKKDLSEAKAGEFEKDILLEEKAKAIRLLETEMESFKILDNIQASGNTLKSSNFSEAHALVNDTLSALQKVDQASSTAQPNVTMVKSSLEQLRESIQKMLHLFLNDSFDYRSTSFFPEKMELTPMTTDRPNTNITELLRFFVVVMDYDPLSLCITGHPEQELTLSSGTMVVVIGEMNDQGYYIARYNGQEGVVPANFIQEIQVKDAKYLINRASLMNEVPISPKSSYWVDIGTSHSITSISESFPNADSAEMSVALLGGTTMSTTALENLRERETSASQKLDEEKMFLATCDYDPSRASSSAHSEFELLFKEGDLLKVYGEKMADDYYIAELNGKRGFVPAGLIVDTKLVRSTVPCLATTKTMRALFDYHPERDSPNLNLEMELSFNAGDTVTVYGVIHDDGFYTGHLKQRIGLVPSNFMEPTN